VGGLIEVDGDAAAGDMDNRYERHYAERAGEKSKKRTWDIVDR
jgi:hypothetical protein